VREDKKWNHAVGIVWTYFIAVAGISSVKLIRSHNGSTSSVPSVDPTRCSRSEIRHFDGSDTAVVIVTKPIPSGSINFYPNETGGI
jgi:hypothetical protein